MRAGRMKTCKAKRDVTRVNRERPDGVIRARDRLRGFLSAGDTALDERMAKSQESAAEVQSAREITGRERKARLEAERRFAGRLSAINDRGGVRISRVLYCMMCVLVCVTMIALLLYTSANLPTFGDASDPIHNEVAARYIEKGLEETGAVNIVTGMILDYRAFDTLGESTVLFAAAMVVMLLLRLDPESDKYSELARLTRENPSEGTFYEPHQDAILQKTAMILAPIVVLLGVYVVLNGHISPGGGFSGGAIIGAGLMIYAASFGTHNIRRFFTYKTYQTVVLTALLTYALSKCYSFYTGANGIHSVIPLGTPGAILSSGLIFVLNVCVGFIVACTMYAFYAVFRKGEV